MGFLGLSSRDFLSRFSTSVQMRKFVDQIQLLRGRAWAASTSKHDADLSQNVQPQLSALFSQMPEYRGEQTLLFMWLQCCGYVLFSG